MSYIALGTSLNFILFMSKMWTVPFGFQGYCENLRMYIQCVPQK